MPYEFKHTHTHMHIMQNISPSLCVGRFLGKTLEMEKLSTLTWRDSPCQTQPPCAELCTNTHTHTRRESFMTAHTRIWARFELKTINYTNTHCIWRLNKTVNAHEGSWAYFKDSSLFNVNIKFFNLQKSVESLQGSNKSSLSCIFCQIAPLLSLPLLNVYHDRMPFVLCDDICMHTLYLNSFSGLI